MRSLKINIEEGFTLIELLIGIVLLGVVSLAMMQFFVMSSKFSASSNSGAEMQQDILTAQQLIAGRLKEAWYVYPTGSAIGLTNTNTKLVTNPRTGLLVWTIGDTPIGTTAVSTSHPILAMILPPLATGGFYRFYAYYAVLRSNWMTNIDKTQLPAADPNNPSTWVLAEYSANMPATFVPTGLPSAAPAVPASGNINLLADYIAPTTATGVTTAYDIFTYNPSTFTYTLNSGVIVTNLRSVRLNLAAFEASSGEDIRLPNRTDEYELTIGLPNLGK